MSVYRARNAENVRQLALQVISVGGAVALWSLDEAPDPELETWTVGHGAGPRSRHLNALVASLPRTVGRWLVVADDDVELTHVSVDRLVRIVRNAQLDLAQPAHSGRSAISHPVTLTRALSIARRTRFVEIGPIFVASPRIQQRILPMDETLPMGLGLDLIWSLLSEEGYLLGIVDCAVMVHAGPIAAGYESDHARVDELTAAAGG
ncbi:MAG: hypothetical protein ACRDYW_04150, partial [Acidimicrobiales bacterium]